MILAALLSLAPVFPPQAPTAARRPNVVLILADDLGYKDVGYQGSRYATPNIDRLAAESVRFSCAYAASPTCSPTRASLWTGKHPARLGLTRAIRNADYLAARAEHAEKND